MEWNTPKDVSSFIARLDTFIDEEIKPLERANPEYFDHRREYFRTDWENDGVPSRPWQEILAEMRSRSDAAGVYRYGLPASLGGAAAGNLAMAHVREHLTARAPGLHFPYADEASVVGNLPIALVLLEYGTAEQRKQYLEPLIAGSLEIAFSLTEPRHGSDATYLESRARRHGSDWVIDGVKRYITLAHDSAADLVFARTSGTEGKSEGITAFLVPRDAPGREIRYNHWTFNMPSTHAEVALKGVRVPDAAVVGEVGRGLECAQLFIHENRIRQAASSLGAAQYCIDRSVEFTKSRKVFGGYLREQQGVQWQLVSLQTEAELVRNTVQKTAWQMDQYGPVSVSDKVSMVNMRGNQLACEAADRAIQVHGGLGYTRALPFEHIYRHHRRYRINEGTDEIQMRRIAKDLFGFGSDPARRN